MLLTRWTVLGTTLFLFFSAASAASAQEARLPDPLFQDTQVLDVRVTAPLTTLLDERPLDQELPAKLQYADSSGQTVEFDIKIRTRGKFRRKKDICSFPPMRLNFKASETKGTLFHKQNKVKLVTHCENNTRYEQVILREYTAYRILNVMTDASFRVRLLRITYVDSEGNKRDDVSHGFIIEHRDRLAKRLEKDYLELPGTKVSALDPAYMNLVSMYQYLIGNTDFSPVKAAIDQNCCHNHVLFGNDGEPILSIPYDFDQAGIVNAPHAGPNPRFKLRNVKERLYRGRCTNNDRLPETIALYNAKQEQVMAVLREVEDASQRSMKLMTNYVKGFYSTINSQRRINGEFVKKCI
ncbi:MAG: hypothetical protein GWP67_00840 [Gammaproteobacteria bacterium]|jgi:hypothetical protein|nr:hypothetical protein [Gammaproteobacteria bacterium]